MKKKKTTNTGTKSTRSKRYSEKLYVIAIAALIIGVLIGAVISNLKTLGKSTATLTDSSPISECCYGLNSNGSTYTYGISSACCILMDEKYTGYITNKCTEDAYNQEECNADFKRIMSETN